MIYSQTLGRKEIIYSEYLETEIVDLLGNTFNIPESYQCDVVPVEDGFECRPDLISDDIYGDEMYADILTKLNGPSNPFELSNTQHIILPSVDSVTNFIQNPNTDWSTPERDTTRPKAKARHEKRKPNEAVVGDKRFNIDPQSKIIIY